jgi:flagellar biosynthesis regulator FlbT
MDTRVLTVGIQSDTELSPGQQRFNALLARVASLSSAIESLERLSTTHRTSHLSQMAALQSQTDVLCKQLLVFLHERIQSDVFTGTHRRIASQVILALCKSLHHTHDTEVQAILKAHHSEEDAQDLADDARARAEHAKQVFEALFGRAIEGDEEFDSVDAVFQAGLRQYHAEQGRLEEKRQARKAKKKSTARQEKDVQQAMDAKTALRTIYRQLASALHPDRETDAAERVRKTELMSAVNAAYDRRNLSELLKLQLQIAQIDNASLGRMADDKLDAMSLLLKEQISALEKDHAQAEFEIQHVLGVPPSEQSSPERFAQALAMKLHHMEQDAHVLLRDLKRIQNDAELKRWLKEQAQLTKEARSELTDLDRLLAR